MNTSRFVTGSLPRQVFYEIKRTAKEYSKTTALIKDLFITSGYRRLPDEETKGLNQTNEGLFSIRFMNESKWDPHVL